MIAVIATTHQSDLLNLSSLQSVPQIFPTQLPFPCLKQQLLVDSCSPVVFLGNFPSTYLMSHIFLRIWLQMPHFLQSFTYKLAEGEEKIILGKEKEENA